MKPSVLAVSNEFKKDFFPVFITEKYEITWVADLEAALRALKKGSYDLCFIHAPNLRKNDIPLLKQVQKSGKALDLLVAIEKEKFPAVLDFLAENSDLISLPYSVLELKRKFDAMSKYRSLEKENRFWRVELSALWADRETLSRQDIPAEFWEKGRGVKGKEEAKPFKRSRKEFERQCLRQALERAQGNQTQAAKAMGIHRNTLIWKMKNLHLEEEYQKLIRRRRGKA